MGNLLKPAMKELAFAKVGLYGFQGAGKTFTATQIAIGLLQMQEKITGKKGKGAIFDTETGADFIQDMFKEAGYEFLVAKSRSFKDVKSIFEEAIQEGCGVLIIDSITHVWRDLTDSYQKSKDKKYLTIQDWMYLKREWGVYTDIFVNSPIHTIVCGRAGWEYDIEKGSDGKTEIIKTGTKMKAETEFGFEPSLVIEMIRRRKEEATKNKPGKAGGISENVGIVMKDRADRIDGKEFVNPVFEDFLPHFETLNIGGTHFGVDTTRTSEDMFGDDGKSRYNYRKQHDVLIEEIGNLFTLQRLGTGKDEKAFKLEVLKEVFGKSTWVEIEKNMNNDDLEFGVKVLRVGLETVCNKFKGNHDVDVEEEFRDFKNEALDLERGSGSTEDGVDDIPEGNVGKSLEGEKQGELLEK